ncbi:CRISPR-associated endonuclease Cas1 [Meiothermus granaticius]|uniref:CRISPR-associated endonuclease Cas1 n=1 Tax=Meiothermus granaticius NBRC 107808 TaxID=1227551 RepID=A0A399F974_9DEIN|nr:CRISPR-associated endonuclease Cas1 [Meiothermus granaticius]RIH91462.1 CRISPR-associated endonuclease Cas1 [Meiothermus granaticius NBRC 107808]GEM87853.1 CRISPR-associated endonuclease Cas1 1 [Meiothermus granaticius NBRC 107808]
MTLHLTEQSATLRLRQGRLLVELDEQILAQLPARKVRGVVVWGNVRLTTPALAFLLRQEVPVLYTTLEGQLYGQAIAPQGLPPEVLRAQMQAQLNPLPLALGFIEGKLRSAISVLERLARQFLVAPHLQELRAALEALPQVPHLQALRGTEGNAARAYFGGLQHALSPFGFTGRNRRPPTDAVNAALSYGYMVLLGRTLLALHLAGLHPELGLLHAEGRRAAALAFDLMEEFRVPVVDAVVVGAFLRAELHPQKHSEAKGGGVYLNDTGRKTLLRLLEARFAQEAQHPRGFRQTYQALIETQAARLKAALLGRESYTPFYLWR